MASINYTSLANQMCQAVDNLIENALSNAGFDKTVVATILSCTDEETGTYRVTYLGGEYTATATELGKRYKTAESVYMLIPEGDFTKQKKIIGLVNNSDSKTTESSEEERVNYEIIGNNLLEINRNVHTDNYFSYCSYGTYSEFLILALKAIQDFLTNNTILANQNYNSNIFKEQLQHEDFNYDEHMTSIHRLLQWENRDIGETYENQYTFNDFHIVVNNYLIDYQLNNITLDVLYDVNSPETSKIKIADENIIRDCMKDATHLQFDFQLKTRIPQIQQAPTGNFGVVFEFEYYLNKNSQTTTITKFLFDKHSLTGTIFNLSDFIHQKMIFEKSGALFKRINKISFFVEGFNYNHADYFAQQGNDIDFPPADIFIQDLGIYIAVDANNKKWDSYYMSFQHPNGTILTDNVTSLQTIAKVTYKTNEIETDNLDFYWFFKNPSITTQDDEYCEHGGQGWACLNTYTYRSVINAQNQSIEKKIWEPGTNTLDISTAQLKANRGDYKCVAIYRPDATVEPIVKEFSLYNNNATLSIAIESSSGLNYFVLDQGIMDLTCNIYRENSLLDDATKYNFYWSEVTSTGVYTPLDANNGGMEQKYDLSNLEIYHILKELQDNISLAFADGVWNKTDSFYPSQLKQISEYFADEQIDFSAITKIIYQVIGYNTSKVLNGEYTKQQFYKKICDCVAASPSLSCIEQNVFHNLNAKVVDGTSIISCSVFDSNNTEDGTIVDGAFLGSADFIVYDLKYIESANYVIDIFNSNQTFKYDSTGKSPLNRDNEIKQTIQPLAFELYDADGNKVDIERSKIEYAWKIPVDNTMLVALGEDLEKDAAEEYYLIKTPSLEFGIEETYQYINGNNDIILEVTYLGQLIRKHTNFTFVKDGVNGTNGTDYHCRITTINDIDGYPTIYCGYKNGELFTTANFASNIFEDIIAAEEHWFEAELWDSGKLIEPDGVSWSILTNNEPSAARVLQTYKAFNNLVSLKINEEMLKDVLNKDSSPLLVLQATVTYNKLKYYATMPITLVYLPEYTYNDTVMSVLDQGLRYFIEMKPNTGYHEAIYATDGTNPQMNFAFPFEMSIKEVSQLNLEDVAPDEEDVTISTVIAKSDVTANKNQGYCFAYQWDTFGNNSNRREVTYTDYIKPVFKQDEYDDDGNPVIDGEASKEVVSVPSEYNIGDNKLHISNTWNNKTLALYQCNAIPPSRYDGYSLANGLKCTISLGQEKKTNIIIDKDSNSTATVTYRTAITDPIAIMYFPIHFYLNRYGHARLNDWDGNSIKINEEENYILAPQVGAGKKEEDNSFTGVLIGTVKEADKDKEDVGLMGYGHGERTIFLDANSGKAEFGVAGKGQIIMDPTQGKAIIKSGNYIPKDESTNQPGEGLKIDLTTPEIRFGSENFYVGPNGIVHATGAQIQGDLQEETTIGIWVLADDCLYTNWEVAGTLSIPADSTKDIQTTVEVGTAEENVVEDNADDKDSDTDTPQDTTGDATSEDEGQEEDINESE